MSTAFVDALPVVIGGLLAIGGGIGGQLITHKLDARREAKSLYRDRIERLTTALHSHSQWLKDRSTSQLYQNKDIDRPSPLPEAQMLQELYFPELEQQLIAVMKAELDVLKFINTQLSLKIKDRDAWADSFDFDTFMPVYEAHRTALVAATKKCRETLLNHI